MVVKTLDGQSLFDLAIQTGGVVESVVDLAIANGLEITNKIDAGMPMEYLGIIDKGIATYYKSKKLKPATYVSKASVPLTGIGSMIIEENFTVV